jgi:threonine dehydrogenase-like Zn-dependent dehydrogenase
MALTYDSAWQLTLAPQTVPACPDTGVVVEIAASGICGTDLAIVSGGYNAAQGVVIGHEAAGIIAAAGARVNDLRIGQRVVINPTYFCGCCRMCRTGRENHCVAKKYSECGVTKDGTFARYHINEAAFIYALEDHVSFEAATFVEPLSCVLNAVNKLYLRPGLQAVVCGGGPIGLLAAWVLHYKGLTGYIIEIGAFRRKLLVDLLPSGFSVIESLDDVARSLDVAVDTSSSSVASLVPRMERGGQILTLGLKPQRSEIDVGALADKSLSIVGSIDSQDNSFQAALNLINQGIIPTGKFVSRRFPLKEYENAFAVLGCDLRERTWARPAQAMKVVLVP